MADEIIDANEVKFGRMLASFVENRSLVIGTGIKITRDQITEALMNEFGEHPDWDYQERLRFVKNHTEGALRLLGVNDESVIAFYVNYFKRELADREEIITDGGAKDTERMGEIVPFPKK